MIFAPLRAASRTNDSALLTLLSTSAVHPNWIAATETNFGWFGGTAAATAAGEAMWRWRPRYAAREGLMMVDVWVRKGVFAGLFCMGAEMQNGADHQSGGQYRQTWGGFGATGDVNCAKKSAERPDVSH